MDKNARIPFKNLAFFFAVFFYAVIVSSALQGGRLNRGDHQEYLTTLQQQSLNVYMQTLDFNNQDDDYLIQQIIQNNQVAGFWIQ